MSNEKENMGSKKRGCCVGGVCDLSSPTLKLVKQTTLFSHPQPAATNHLPVSFLCPVFLQVEQLQQDCLIIRDEDRERLPCVTITVFEHCLRKFQITMAKSLLDVTAWCFGAWMWKRITVWGNRKSLQIRWIPKEEQGNRVLESRKKEARISQYLKNIRWKQGPNYRVSKTLTKCYFCHTFQFFYPSEKIDR